ncbi:MAG: CxxC-x17-CxxC domain-containing protein [Patescibacteria group bacterium]
MSDYSAPRFPRKQFGNKPFGNKPFGNKGGFDKGPREMFKTDCAKCGNVCEVPFRPNGTKPVYCNNCFVRDSSGDDRGPRRDFAPHPTFQDAPKPQVRDDQAFKDLKAELRGVNERLDRVISLMTVAATAPKVEKVSKKKAK